MGSLSVKYVCLAVADHLLVLFLFFPLMICYWRGIWDIVGVYIFPDQEPVNHWVKCGIGVAGVWGYFAAQKLDTILDRKKRITYVMISRTFMYLFAACLMTYWRGVWLVANHYLGTGWKASLGGACTSMWILCVLRCSRNVIFPPFFTIIDTRDDLLTPVPRFHEHTGGRPVLFALDALFTQAIVWGLVIFTWRSGWNVLDHFVLPEDEFLSNVSCLIAGYGLVIFLFLIQQPLSRISSHLDQEGHKFFKVIYEDFMYVIIFFATLVVWRGGWNLNATYLLSDPELGGWVNHIGGTIGLLVTQNFGYAGAVGVTIDGSNPGGQAFFPNKWLRVYLWEVKQDEQEKEVEKDSKMGTITDEPSNVKETEMDEISKREAKLLSKIELLL